MRTFSFVSSSVVALLLAATIPLGCGPVTAVQIDCGDPNACSGHGTCGDSGGSATCHCDTGWAGQTCDRCADGYALDTTGECTEIQTCEQACAAQGRTCIGIQGDINCGGCLDGWYEENGRCIQACAADTVAGELVPLDIYIMLDRSSSMDDAGKWSSVTSAITTFVNAPDTVGIGVGLQYFPVPPTATIPTSCASDSDCGLYGPCLPGFNQCGGSFATDTSCDPADYDEAEVDIAELPGVQSAILSSLNNASPNGSATPTEQAMGGAVTYATAWAQTHPDHLVYIVFATDGEPTGCSTNSVSGTADLAQGAAGGTPPVLTYVIGVGDGLDALNQIASAGGTGQAVLVDAGAGATQAFIDALNEVRANGLCKYQIPQPTGGGDIDYGLINVSTADPNDPTNATTIFNVPDEASCDPTLGGWFYDDPIAPEMILLCPATCNAVQMDNLAVNILVGCETVVQ